MSPLALMGIWNKNDCSEKIGVDFWGGALVGSRLSNKLEWFSNQAEEGLWVLEAGFMGRGPIF
jgi:hypothetical protein